MKLGAYTASDQTSYYTFTTTVAGDYYMDGANTVSYALGTDSTFTTFTAFGVSSGFWLSGLQANTTYYLKETNASTTPASFSATILNPAAIASTAKAEGSPLNPIALGLGVAHSGTVGASSHNGTSYYTFTTGSTPFTKVSLSSIAGTSSAVSYSIYDASGYSLAYGTSPGSTYILAANKTYGLRTYEYSTSTTSDQTTYSLTVDAAATPTATVLPLGTSTQETIASGTPFQILSVTVPGPGNYAVSWEDKYQQSTGANNTLDITMGAYNADYTSTYFSGVDSGYLTPTNIAVGGTGAQTINLVVTPFSSNSFGTYTVKVSPNSGSLVVNVQ
jgi:hypothetical protein